VKNGDGAGIGRPTYLVLRNQRDDRGTRHLSASPDPRGGVRIDGHDLGGGVEHAFGCGLSEYEWSWGVEPEAVSAAIAALDGRDGDDPLKLLVARSVADGGADPGLNFVTPAFRSPSGTGSETEAALLRGGRSEGPEAPPTRAWAPFEHGTFGPWTSRPSAVRLPATTDEEAPTVTQERWTPRVNR
jgi:hypothetical protein